MPTVNDQVIDAVVSTNVKVLGEAAAQALGVAYQSLAQSTGLAMENAMMTQGGMQQITNSATSVATSLILKQGSGGG
ncbi:Killing trait domain-containing protein [Tistlia consotensis]|uniref:Killing trait domain-containing protein n=1 Tax=Tistlia consotensis USBA 355 TaxID=560819 RepID=A0A1Y6BLN1_9PROT|nr:RebB family R body protein [Tistlia consotensis]SMF09961.1 Killing trait domain-containing protein [Tistlia consotensis USBA 355]SNR34116.1 Killing trait domain-containing protein [Tistlia consotensis]